MRASLASATSFLALLLMQRHEVSAGPIVAGSTQPIDFGGVLIHRADAPLTSQWTINRHPAAEIGPFSPTSGLFAIAGNNAEVGADRPTLGYYFSPPGRTTSSDTFVGADVLTAGTAAKGNGVAPLANSPATSVIANFALGDLRSSDPPGGSRAGNAYASGTAGQRSGDRPANVANGSGNGGDSVFVGTTSSISLQDGRHVSTGPQSSASYAYTFKPTTTGSSARRFGDAVAASDADGSDTAAVSDTGMAAAQPGSPAASATDMSAGDPDLGSVALARVGNLAWTSPALDLNGAATASAATSTLGYTYTPAGRGTGANAVPTTRVTDDRPSGVSRSVAALPAGVGLGPALASAVDGADGSANSSTAINSGTTGPTVAAGATISFGTLGYKHAATIYPELRNVTAGPFGILANLTIDKYAMNAANAPSSAGAESGFLLMPTVVVNAMGAGVLSSSLTIFTDESVAMGGLGEAFTYALTSLDVPEPAALSVLAGGLAGLAGFRRWRRAAR